MLKPSAQGSFFWVDWFEGSHVWVYLKNEHFSIYLLRKARNVCCNHQNRARFSQLIDLRGHMPRFTWKMNIFPSISLEMPEMCVETIRTELIFLRWLIWGVTCLGFLGKNECFPIYLLRNARNVCLNLQEMVRFSESINLRGHMPRFTWKMNIFSSISLEMPEMCVETVRTELVFLRWSIWVVTCLGLIENESFSIYLLQNAINVCWNPQHRAHFSEMIDLRGHMSGFTWKMNISPSISLERPETCVVTTKTGLVSPRWLIWGVTCLGLLEKWTFSHLSPAQPYKCVLKPSEQGLFFWDDWFEGSHA